MLRQAEEAREHVAAAEAWESSRIAWSALGLAGQVEHPAAPDCR